jgi:hypothetical protein
MRAKVSGTMDQLDVDDTSLWRNEARISSCSFVTIGGLIIISVLFYTVAHAENRIYTLDDCFKLALERSTTVATSIDQIDQADAQIKQAQ